MSDHTYKPGDRVRLRKHKDVEGRFVTRSLNWPDLLWLKLDLDESDWRYSVQVSLDAIEPVPPPTFDPANLCRGDLVKGAKWSPPFFVTYVPNPGEQFHKIDRVWRLDESGDYRLIFPPREEK